MPIYCGVDFHAQQQVVAWCDISDGEIRITKLDHSDLQKVREFYNSLPSQVIIGLEASGYSQWFEDLLFELRHVSGSATPPRFALELELMPLVE
jgi:hypothetical protein